MKILPLYLLKSLNFGSSRIESHDFYWFRQVVSDIKLLSSTPRVYLAHRRLLLGATIYNNFRIFLHPPTLFIFTHPNSRLFYATGKTNKISGRFFVCTNARMHVHKNTEERELRGGNRNWCKTRRIKV